MKAKRIDTAMLELARMLLAKESGENSDLDRDAAYRVLEKLRLHLAKLVGATGFEALFNRSLTLARTEAPWLKAVRIKGDGSFEGFDGSSLDQDSSEILMTGYVTLVAWFCALLVTFIGDGLTLRLLSNVWPDLSLNEMSSSRPEGSSDQKEKSLS